MPEQIKEVLQLRGLNLRQEAADVEEPESRKLVNLDPFQKPGALVVRRGTEVLGGPLQDDLVRAIARINGVRYQVAGRRLYRGFSAITGPYLAKNKKTSFAAFRPLDDSVTWAFIADDDWMLKSDATRLFQWGIDEPLSPDPKVANQTGVTPGDTIAVGTYKIAITQLRWDHSVIVSTRNT
jgi:hypothetical protein